MLKTKLPLDDTSHDILVSQLRFQNSCKTRVRVRENVNVLNSKQNTFVFIGGFLPPSPESLDETEEWLDSGENVEGRREGRPWLEVTDPQLCPGKLPLPANINLIIIMSSLSIALQYTVLMLLGVMLGWNKEMKCSTFSPLSCNRQVCFCLSYTPTLLHYPFSFLRLGAGRYDKSKIKLVLGRAERGGRNFIFSSLCLLFCLMKI